MLVCFSKTAPNVMKILSVLLARRTFSEQAKKTALLFVMTFQTFSREFSHLGKAQSVWQ